MLTDLGLTSYRFSIEWSRLEPEEGSWNNEAMDIYSQMIDDLISRGIRPTVTLHHFSHPVWWEEKEVLQMRTISIIFSVIVNVSSMHYLIELMFGVP